jgi:hypothetical protein
VPPPQKSGRRSASRQSRTAGKPEANAYLSVVRVLSAPFDSDNKEEYWKTNDGERLRATSVGLLSDALRLMFGELNTDAGTQLPYRSIRYQEGGHERVERAQVLSETCERIIARTLRGWIFSVPRSTDSAGTDANNGLSCPSAPAPEPSTVRPETPDTSETPAPLNNLDEPSLRSVHSFCAQDHEHNRDLARRVLQAASQEQQRLKRP